MPLHKVEIGGYIFEVICRDGEEDFLNAAAKLLDDEAREIAQAQGRVGESRTLLMAGLLLADRMAGLQKEHETLKSDTEQNQLALQDQASGEELSNKNKELEGDLEAKSAEIARLKQELAERPAAEPAPASDPAAEQKTKELLEHKSAQVNDLMARLAAATAVADAVPEQDPYMQATIEAERDEAQSEAEAAISAQNHLQAELDALKEERDQRSKAESAARDELEAEISKIKRELEEAHQNAGGNAEIEERLAAAEKTIERMVATAEAAAADLAGG